MEEAGLDAMLFVGDSVCDSDMYYLSHFLTSDRFTLLTQERISLLVSSMERGRASKESTADDVISTSEYGIRERLSACSKPDEAYMQVLLEFLRDRGVNRLGVPTRFPAGLYCHLAEHLDVSILESPVSRWRAVKSPIEIAAIRTVQQACEKAMLRALQLIAGSEPRGEQLYRQGQPLTSEQVRSSIEVSLLKEGCEAVDTIVAGGLAGADPHARGAGVLPANAPIVIDIFPRSKSSRYFADMTRTVLKGEASLQVREIYEAVLQAQNIGISAVRAGESGKEVHSRVSEVFRECGYPDVESCGFTHSTGHGVGLEIHERPSLGVSGEILEAGQVVTVEPGLYFPDIGGVRLEDLVVVREGSCENLTHFERRLVL